MTHNLVERPEEAHATYFMNTIPGLAVVDYPPGTSKPIFAAGSLRLIASQEEDSDRPRVKPRQSPADDWHPSRQMQGRYYDLPTG